MDDRQRRLHGLRRNSAGHGTINLASLIGELPYRNGEDHAPEGHKAVFIRPTELFGKPVPERQWVVQDWLPVGTLTINFGDGGVGKSLLAQTLMTSCATRRPWCGLAVAPCRTLALFCEDSEDELHHRQDQINAALGVNFDELDDMLWMSGVGQDNTLVTFTRDGIMEITPKFYRLKDAALAHRSGFVMLDPATDLFAGNENDRHQVRQYCNVLSGLALDINGAVLLNAHPSRSGMATGNYDGGSTAWSNSCRSRWSLARPAAVGDEQPDANERILTRRKANYASIGDTINLRWAGGALVPVTQQGGVFGSIARQNVEDVFLTLLDRCAGQGVFVSHGSSSPSFAPKVFAARPDRDGNTRKDFEGALSRLFEAQKIRVGARKNGSRHSISCIVREGSGEPG